MNAGDKVMARAEVWQKMRPTNPDFRNQATLLGATGNEAQVIFDDHAKSGWITWMNTDDLEPVTDIPK